MPGYLPAEQGPGHHMANGASPVTQLTTSNLMIGGIATLGLIAMSVGAALGRLPDDWLPRAARFVDDAVFLAILLCGPACLVGGIGLWQRRRWGRQVALSMGGLAGTLALACAVLTAIGVMQASNGLLDYFYLGLFAGYCVVTFVILWNDPFADELPLPPQPTAPLGRTD